MNIKTDMNQMLFLLCAIYFVICGADISAKYKVVKTDKDEYYFVTLGKFTRSIPDKETINQLGFDAGNVSSISQTEFALLTIIKEPIPSLVLKKPNFDSMLPDDQMDHRIQRIIAYDPANYMVDIHYLVGHGETLKSYNPSILKLPDKKILFNWRSTDWDAQAVFGFYDLSTHTITPEPSWKIPSSIVYNGNKNIMQDDTRMHLISSNSETCEVLLLFSGVFGGKEILQSYSVGTYHYTTSKLDISPAKLLDFTDGHQKNWTPFTYKKELYFFQSLNPVRVLQIAGPVIHDLKDPQGDRNIVSVRTVSKLSKVENLPWNGGLYGDHIRGGTPAIMLKGVLFSLFHTQIRFSGKMSTYFMGAITHCPHPPFHIHSMSTVPMLKKEWYEGPWDTGAVNYVIFPTGIMMDDDEKHVWISAGWQDKHGYMIKMNIDELFEQLTEVSPCHQHNHHNNSSSSISSISSISSGSGSGNGHNKSDKLKKDDNTKTPNTAKTVTSEDEEGDGMPPHISIDMKYKEV